MHLARGEKGAALVMVMVAIMILLAIATTMLMVASGEFSTVSTIGREEREFPPISQLEPPAADPPSGSYDRLLNVALSSPEEGVEIYYTKDGSDPWSNGILYTGPIEVGSSTTIKAFCKKGDMRSEVAQFDYTILRPEAPTADPPPGMYANPVAVILSCPTSGAFIYYTTNGNDPREGGTLYVGPVTLTLSTVIKARAFKNGLWSDVVSFEYIIGQGFAFIDRDYDNTYDPGEEVVPKSRLEKGELLCTPYRLVIPYGVGEIRPFWLVPVNYQADNGIIVGKEVSIITRNAKIDLNGGAGPVIIDQAQVGSSLPFLGTGEVNIQGGSVEIKNGAELASASGLVTVRSGSGAVKIADSRVSSTWGGVEVEASGGLFLSGQNAEVSNSTGGVLLRAGGLVDISQASVSSDWGEVRIQGQEGVSISGQPNRPAVVRSYTGQVILKADSGQLSLSRSQVSSWSDVRLESLGTLDARRFDLSSTYATVEVKAQDSINMFDPGNPNDPSTVAAGGEIRVTSVLGDVNMKMVQASSSWGGINVNAGQELDLTKADLKALVGASIRLSSGKDADLSGSSLNAGGYGEIVVTAGTLNPLRTIYVNQAQFRDADDTAQAYPRDLTNSIAVNLQGNPRYGYVTNGLITR